LREGVSGKQERSKNMTIFERIADGVQKGSAPQVGELVKEALANNIPAGKILNDGLVGGMNIVSDKFKNYECFIPEVLISARAMNLALQILKPHLGDARERSPGKIVIGTIQGDLHDIGKNIVAMLLQGAGFEVVDLGADVPVEQFVKSAEAEKADIVGISALLSSTMENMKAVIQGLKKAGMADTVRVIVGGAPVTEAYAREIEADGYADDAASGVDVVKELLGV
jgi:5-methyltetrahydrofolate--homocysteine methyltransferase